MFAGCTPPFLKYLITGCILFYYTITVLSICFSFIFNAGSMPGRYLRGEEYL
jgi:hypothetical protein